MRTVLALAASLVVFVAFFAVVAFFTTSGERSQWIKESDKFTKTKGRITSLIVHVNHGSPYSPGIGFDPMVGYKFVVNNVVVEGSRIRQNDATFGTRKDAEEYLKNFHVGQEVDVYYDPKYPQTCCLIPARLEAEAAARGYAKW